MSLVKGTFQDSLATLFNALPANVRRCPDFNTFKNNCFTILKSRASSGAFHLISCLDKVSQSWLLIAVTVMRASTAFRKWNKYVYLEFC